MRDYISEFNRSLRYIYLAAAVAFVSYFTYKTIIARKLYLTYKFKGIVEHVSYDGKSIPTVTINKKDYYLGASTYNFNHLINRGDSIEKDSGILTIKLIKQKNGIVLMFDGTHYYAK